MKLNLSNITFIIVSFKSENVIHTCLKSLPQNSKKIIIENSKNTKLKEDLLSNYDNIEVLMNQNLGMGASNNIGILRSNTQFVYILNPDTKLNELTLNKLFEATDKLDDFAILSPLSSNNNFPNYKIFNNLAYGQWTLKEIESGEAWNSISKFKFTIYINSMYW